MLLIIDMLSSASNPFKLVKIITLQMLCQGRKTAEIVTINPLSPSRLGDFLIWGAPPDPRQEVSCTSFSTVS